MFDRFRGRRARPDDAGQQTPPLIVDLETAVPLVQVGVVRTKQHDPRRQDWSGVRSTIEVDPEWVEALTGLDGFSHAIVVTWLHLVTDEERAFKQVYPAGDRSLPLLGVFALRTHHRPNPLGISVVRIESVNGSNVDVLGLDAVDGTPVLDIKPYLPPYDSVPDARLPGWAVGKPDR